jgi:hypothetical protein
LLEGAGANDSPGRLRRRVRRAGRRRGLLDQCAAADMDGWDHGGGFSVDASVRNAGADRAGLELLIDNHTYDGRSTSSARLPGRWSGIFR